MNSEGNYSSHLTPETIKLYLEGKLDSSAMHAVEMHLLECAFCADAAEGFELSQQSRVKTEQTLLSLRKKLNQKIKEHERPRMISWPAWSAAAGIALAIAGYVVIKQQETQEQYLAIQQSADFLQTGVNDTLIIFLPEAPRPVNHESLLAESKQEAPATVSGYGSPGDTSPADTARQPQELRLPAAADQRRIAAQSQPARRISKETLDVSQDSKAETAAAGRELAPEQAAVQLRASPKGGQQAYEKYLSDSLRYPDEALESKVDGAVTVRFTVRPSGRPAAFSVVRSLGYGCDEEAIRLIKEGPDWISPVVKRGQAQPVEAVQTVIFELPQTQ